MAKFNTWKYHALTPQISITFCNPPKTLRTHSYTNPSKNIVEYNLPGCKEYIHKYIHTYIHTHVLHAHLELNPSDDARRLVAWPFCEAARLASDEVEVPVNCLRAREKSIPLDKECHCYMGDETNIFAPFGYKQASTVLSNFSPPPGSAPDAPGLRPA